MIRIMEIDRSKHGDTLTTYLSKRGIEYTVDYTQEEYEGGLFNIHINEISSENLKLNITCDKTLLSIDTGNVKDGYDIARNEFYSLLVI